MSRCFARSRASFSSSMESSGKEEENGEKIRENTQTRVEMNTHSSCASCSSSGCSKTAISSTPSSIP